MIFPRSLLKSVLFTRCNVTETALTNSNYPTSTNYIDCSLYDHVAFLVDMGTIADALTFAVYQDTSATQTANIKALAGATVTITATDDNNYFLIEFNTAKLDSANGFRYVTLTVTGVSGSNYAAILFIGTHARSEPVTQSTYCAATSVVLGG